MRSKRPGFSLIELLLVMAIIATLIGLLLPAIGKVVATTKRTANMWEMHQLKIGLEGFKSRCGSYPPSRFRLYNDYPDGRYATDQLDSDSANYASRIFGQTGGVAWADPTNTISPPDGWCQPLPNQTNPPPPLPFWELEGDQCLVFFLAGPPDFNGAGTPTYVSGTLGFQTKRLKGPGFYEFKPEKLAWRKKNGFFSYLDTYGESDRHGNVPGSDPTTSGFSKAHSKPWVYFAPRGGQYNQYAPSDAIAFPTSLTSSVLVGPYILSGARFNSPGSFQLLSAGQDRLWGDKMSWYAADPYLDGTPGWDDIASFHDRQLGVP